MNLAAGVPELPAVVPDDGPCEPVEQELFLGVVRAVSLPADVNGFMSYSWAHNLKVGIVQPLGQAIRTVARSAQVDGGIRSCCWCPFVTSKCWCVMCGKDYCMVRIPSF